MATTAFSKYTLRTQWQLIRPRFSSKYPMQTNTISIRHCTQIKMDDTGIPDWIPKFDALPDAPQYLIDFEEDKHTKEPIQSIESNQSDLTKTEDTNNEIIQTDNTFDSQLILDELQNNSIYPSPPKHQFTPSLKEIPSEIIAPIEEKTAMTADDAANWPVPPWHNSDFIEPQRNETQIVVHNVSKYPEMFRVDKNINADLYTTNNSEIMSYEERVTEANIKQQKLRRQKEINDYLTKRREPAKVRKLSIMEDDAFRIKVHLMVAVVLGILYFHFRIKAKLQNKYGYIGSDVERNERLSKLPIVYRTEGDIQHEDDLAHLASITEGVYIKE